jgi:hypothetical protein
MDLNLSLAVNKNYKSSPQIVRVITEEWGTKIYIALLAIQIVSQRHFLIRQLLTLPAQNVPKLTNSKAVAIGVRIR